MESPKYQLIQNELEEVIRQAYLIGRKDNIDNRQVDQQSSLIHRVKQIARDIEWQINNRTLPHLTHRPKGTMCIACDSFNKKDCHLLDFTNMRQIGKDKDGVIVVRCSEFIRETKIEL